MDWGGADVKFGGRLGVLVSFKKFRGSGFLFLFLFAGCAS